MTQRIQDDKKFLCRFSFKLWSTLGKYAKAHEVSMSFIVNEALKKFFKDKKVKVEK